MATRNSAGTLFPHFVLLQARYGLEATSQITMGPVSYGKRKKENTTENWRRHGIVWAVDRAAPTIRIVNDKGRYHSRSGLVSEVALRELAEFRSEKLETKECHRGSC